MKMIETGTDRKSILVFLPNSLRLDSVGFLEGFSKECEDSNGFVVVNDQLKKDGAGSIGYVSSVTPENRKEKTYQNIAQWLHINSNTGELKVFGTDVEYCITCIKYDHKIFAGSEVTLIQTKNYGVYFETLLKSVKDKCSKKYSKNVRMMFDLTFLVLQILTNFFDEVSCCSIFEFIKS